MARELAPAGLRSSPKTCSCVLSDKTPLPVFTTASRPSGSKLPRHGVLRLFAEGHAMFGLGGLHRLQHRQQAIVTIAFQR
ncbi:hypothetical protein C1Y08_14915 [Pseudomonas sp. FW306-02-F02-AA]|nr:hypothetical protein C1Y07_17985 [Pseudomonas sp. FW306-02-F02-AB]PMZ09461.1 hypothetical protein C1Y06_13495 [Pseudomonas sp. FW306-02-H06C]PMZ15043.1 hypothetical protein C1Y08_14915 [Pseudomonas sp. FW306-02-F02-AA]PMZ23595.1 hypothetical protein C1Y09_02080 [Pseudomonas sp. FW306-02-F08-AA]PMZ26502.1 hypothetical protein C1Y05_17425 [Pseudomonas sp. FW306-02-F04-BA]PMZ34141.1 hypothetical protein C1X99_12210 [Pseudomonas sp. FW306-02-H06B]PMZ42064.1 hypothetical protein C1Y00_02715 [Ps